MKKVLITLALIVVIMATTFAFVGCNSQTTIGVQKDTTGHKYVTGDPDLMFDGYSNITVAPYSDGPLAVQALIKGNCDYVIIDNGPAKQMVAANEGKVKMIDIALTTEEYAFGVDKNQATLLTAVNELIAEMKADGRLAALYEKYENATDAELEAMTGIESATEDSSKDQLIVATNAEFAPFEYKIGNKFAGIDMEIAKLIADKLGQELVIKHMEFDAVVTSVGKHGVDIAMAGLTITETRKQAVTFSNTYYSGAYQVLIVKADDTTFDNCTTAAEIEAVLKAL